MTISRYEYNVFINCPFDPQYSELFPCLVFAVKDCGFIPRCALELNNSGEARIEKLYRIIRESKYGIHDISRTELNRHGLPRFNMPLELGIFLGASKYGVNKQKRKICLILDRKQYRYQNFCSDLAGNDLQAHKDSPRQAVIIVRDWFRNANRRTEFPGGETIYKRYKAFEKDLPLLCDTKLLNRNALLFNDLTTMIDEWLESNPLRK